MENVKLTCFLVYPLIVPTLKFIKCVFALDTGPVMIACNSLNSNCDGYELWTIGSVQLLYK